jgi:hypothetical protein
MQIPAKSSAEFAALPRRGFRVSAVRLSTKNAWAQYARNRWPENGVKHAIVEWDLSEGEAKGLIAAQASQPTIDKILDHPRGGFGLGLTILEIRLQTRLLDFLETEKGRLENEARRVADAAAAMDQMASRLPRDGGVGALLSRGERVSHHR